MSVPESGEEAVLWAGRQALPLFQARTTAPETIKSPPIKCCRVIFFLQKQGGKQDHEDLAQLIDRGDPRRISELQARK